MKNWFSQLFVQATEHGRNAIRLAIVFIVAAFLATLVFGYIAAQTGVWQAYIVVVAFAGFFIIEALVISFARRNQDETAGVLLVVAVCYIVLAMTSLMAGIGLGLSIALAVVIVEIVFETLSGSLATRARVSGLAFALAMFLMDKFAAWNRPLLPAVQYAIPAIAAGTVITIAFLIFNRFRFNSWRNFNLRTKLISAFLIVTLIPVAVITYLNYRSTTQALIQAADVKIAGAAKETADEVDAFFINTLTATRVKAQDPVIVNYLLLPASQRTGSVEETQLHKLLDTYSREDLLYVNSIGVIDSNGKSLADTSQAEIGVDKSDRIYYQQAIETGLPYSSELIFSEVTGKASIYFTAPIRNPANASIIGVFRTRYDAGILQTIVAKNAGLAGTDSLPILLDENHIRLAHGVLPELDYKTVVPLSPDALAKLQTENRLPKGSAEQLSTNLPEFEAGLNNIDNKPFFRAVLAVGTDETTAVKLKSHPWIMVFAQTESVFLAPIQTQTRNSLIVALILVLVAAALGFVVAQSLAGPVVRLTAVANQIAAGDIEVQAKVETGDEIGALASTFNAMTAQLRDFITSLEQRVAARTKDLATVAEVGTATATILELKNLLQEVVDLTKERFSLYHSHIYLLDEGGENLVLASGAGEAGRQMVAEGRSIPINREQSLVARAAREQKGVTVNDVTQAPDFLPNPLLPNTRSELAVPMIVGGKVIGVFDVQSDVIGRFTESDINIQTTLAAQVATSVQNVRSFEQSKTQADFESLVNTIGQKIQRATTVEDTLQTAIRELGLALGAKRVTANIGNGNGTNRN